ncbi:MAG: hypothetical protein JXB05_19190 [Myxococcaceae bacterium]|nr:hypothetical protein [Myxococcaceae bacterium]
MPHISAGRFQRLITLLLALTAGCTEGPPEATHSLSSHQQPAASSAEGSWSATGLLAAPRLLHTATLLPDGKVLATGGYTRSTELYEPATGVWSPTADAPNTFRSATATLLKNDQVLVAGAGGAEWDSGRSAALFNPATHTWAATGNLSTPRFHHSATLLPDGRVLVVGGADSEYGGNVLAQPEIYDPQSGLWTPTAPPSTARSHHTATLLNEGKVLVTGGTNGGGALQASAEVYDPTTGTWSPVAAMAVPRANHSATRLADGRVLVAGGGSADWESSASVEVFDPGTGSWTSASPMAKPRRHHSATLLPTGNVLVAGGFHEYTGILTSAELYDATSGSWRSAGDMTENRYLHTATLLGADQVLVTGGFSTGDQASSELYTPALSTPESPTEPEGTSLLLQVVDTAGAPIPTAAISSQDAVFPTDGSGHILFENLPAGRFLARVDALGFSSATAVVDLQAGAHAGAQVKLHRLADPIPFQAEQGGVIQTEQVRVTIPPSAVVDMLGRPVTGTVQVTIAPIDPTTQLATMPGPLEGITSSSGDTVSLESFFMAEVSLWSNGAPVQLAPGASATLEFVLPESLAGQFQEGDSVPAWWLDLDAGHWREEGSGTIQPSQTQPGRLAWVATVHHFTWWNCDAPYTDKSCVDVRVVNRDGAPIPHAQVNAQGVSYTGVSRPAYTGADGRACVEIKRGNTAKLFAGLAGEPITDTVTVTAMGEAAVCGTGSCSQVTLAAPRLICTPGAYQKCPYSGPDGTQGQGACQAGRQQCNVLGTEWSACLGEVLPAPETCTSPFDDDCDGVVNEDCSCSIQEGQPCYGGPAGTQGVGMCHGGTVKCDLFGNAVCQGQQLPRTESCATLGDDDCDGSNECQPVSQWLQRQPGPRCPSARGMVVDGEGNALSLGSFATGTGAMMSLVSKVNGSGATEWELAIPTDFGWDGQELITVDSSGNTLVARRYTTSSASGVIHKLVVEKISAAGHLQWSRPFVGGSDDKAWLTGIAADHDGGVIVTGRFSGILRLGDTEHSSGQPWFEFGYVARFNASTGEPVWSKSLGDYALSLKVAVDGAGNVLWAVPVSKELSLDGVRLIPSTGGSDVFVVKLSGSSGVASGSVRFGKASFSETPSQMKLDGAGNLLLLWTGGHLGSVNSIALTKLTPSGEVLWERSLRDIPSTPGSGSAMMPTALDVDAAGNVLISGSFEGSQDFGGGARASPLPAAFLAWYGANGGYLADTYYPPSGLPSASSRGMAGFDPQGNALLGGSFRGTVDFGSGPLSNACPGYDMFVLKVDPTP